MRINKSLIAFTPTSGGGSGSVTSVALSAPTGFVVTGSPITSSGTLALTFASGYSLPTTIKQSNWDDAYTWVTNFPVGTEGQLVKFDAFGDLEAFTPNFITNPMTSLGDMIYGNAVGLPLRLAPNTTTTKKYLSMTGDGTNGDQPFWDTITGFIGGSGTTNYIPKFTASGTIGNSLIYDNSGSIGIGTITPSQKLHVYNTAPIVLVESSNNTGGQFRAKNTVGEYVKGIEGLTAGGWMDYDVTNSAYITLYRPTSSGFYSIYTNAIERLTINGIGNVGIGTNLPDSILQIIGSNAKGVIFGSAAGAVGTTQITTTSAASPVSSRLMFGTDGTGWQFRIAQNQAGTITDLLTVQTGGNVGINQLNPTEKLDVDGNLKLSGNLVVDTNTLYVDATNNRVGILNASPSYAFDVTGQVRISDALAIGTTPDTNLPFRILKNINSTVGIRFENTSTSSLAFTAVQFGSDVTGGTAFCNFVYCGSGITTNGAFIAGGTTLLSTGSGGLNIGAISQPIRFFTSSGTGTERFRVKNEGQVRFIPLASAPGNAEAGDMYYNSTDNKHYGYNGTSWNALY